MPTAADWQTIRRATCRARERLHRLLHKRMVLESHIRPCLEASMSGASCCPLLDPTVRSCNLRNVFGEARKRRVDSLILVPALQRNRARVEFALILAVSPVSRPSSVPPIERTKRRWVVTHMNDYLLSFFAHNCTSVAPPHDEQTTHPVWSNPS